MNPLTNVKNLKKLNERELKLGFAGNDSKSWHQKYKESAWIFVGGLAYDLSEGDVISVFSQYGEIVNINLVRDKETGKPKGFCFICYEDQRSTNLAVDNLNGIKILNRIIRVDHVEEYKIPKERGDEDDIIKTLHIEGCAPKTIKEEVEKDYHNLEHANKDSRSPIITERHSLKSIKPDPASPEYCRKEPKCEKVSPSRSDTRNDSKNGRYSRLLIEHGRTFTDSSSKKVHSGEAEDRKRRLNKVDRPSEHSKLNNKVYHGFGDEERKSRRDTRDDAYVPKRYK